MREAEKSTLQGFLAWVRSAKSEVKRDMEMARDEVRVMTVHGAKGLEANTVILADTTTPPTGAHPPKLLGLAGGALVWAKRRQDDVGSWKKRAPWPRRPRSTNTGGCSMWR